MGQRDAMLANGVEFLYTNIHTHHGMYPLYQNQKPYFWENEDGKRLLVWSGEHYNLGNALGIVFNKNVNFMTENFVEQRYRVCNCGIDGSVIGKYTGNACNIEIVGVTVFFIFLHARCV